MRVYIGYNHRIPLEMKRREVKEMLSFAESQVHRCVLRHQEQNDDSHAPCYIPIHRAATSELVDLDSRYTYLFHHILAQSALCLYHENLQQLRNLSKHPMCLAFAEVSDEEQGGTVQNLSVADEVSNRPLRLVMLRSFHQRQIDFCMGNHYCDPQHKPKFGFGIDQDRWDYMDEEDQILALECNLIDLRFQCALHHSTDSCGGTKIPCITTDHWFPGMQHMQFRPKREFVKSTSCGVCGGRCTTDPLFSVFECN